jgi:TPR repeat protein
MSVGVGSKIDIAKGIQYYGLAAIQGDVVAQYVLGDCNLEGIGVPKNVDDAVAHY